MNNLRVGGGRVNKEGCMFIITDHIATAMAAAAVFFFFFFPFFKEAPVEAVPGITSCELEQHPSMLLFH